MANVYHSSAGRIYGNGIDLSAVVKSFESTLELDAVDATTISNTGAREYLTGTTRGTFRGEGMLTSGVGSVWEMLTAAYGGTARVIIQQPVGNVAGYPAVGLLTKSTQVGTEQITDAVVGFKFEGSTTAADPGVVGLPWAARTAIGNGATIDAGAASTTGLAAYLVVGDIVGTNAVHKVQHSVDGTTWADLATFTTVTADRSTERIVVASGVTIYRYRRAILSSGTFTSIESTVAIAAL